VGQQVERLLGGEGDAKAPKASGQSRAAPAKPAR